VYVCISKSKIKNPKRRKKLPSKVHINISLIASFILSDFEVNFNKFNARRSKHSKERNINIREEE